MSGLPSDFGENGGGLDAVLFDFDGVIIETEVPAFQAWRELYAEHGHTLERSEWANAVGTVGGFDARERLAELVGRPITDSDVRRRWKRKLELVALEPLRPGVRTLVGQLAEAGIPVGIVSSDTREWVVGNLERLGWVDPWEIVITADGDPTRAKPNAIMYTEAVEALGVAATRTVAIEDSPNGIVAARAAGLRCVAYPNPVTAIMNLSGADWAVTTLEAVTVADLTRLVGAE